MSLSNAGASESKRDRDREKIKLQRDREHWKKACDASNYGKMVHLNDLKSKITCQRSIMIRIAVTHNDL